MSQDEGDRGITIEKTQLFGKHYNNSNIIN